MNPHFLTLWVCRAFCALFQRGARLIAAVLCSVLVQGVAQASDYRVELSYAVDQSRKLTLAEVQALPASAWKDESTRHLSLGYTDAAVWFRVRVTSLARVPQEGMLEITYPVLSDIRAYRSAPAPVSTDEPIYLGSHLPFEQRLVLNRNFVLPFHSLAGERSEWLVRVVTPTSMQFPVVVRNRDKFERNEQAASTAHGIYLGVVLAMLAYNLYLWVASREGVYFWYVGWMLAIAGLVLTMAGVSYQWAWPDSPEWNLASMPFFLSLSAFSGVMFYSALSRIRTHWPRGWQVSRGLAALQIAAITVALVAPYKVAILVGIGSAIFTMTGVVSMAAWMSHRQVAAATSFLKTFMVFVLGGLALAGTKLGWLAASPWLNHAPQASSALAMLLFSVMLAARADAERKLRERTQQELLTQHERWHAELESKVAVRTDELKRLNQTLAKLSRTDALTGLFNRRYLEECVEAELTRCAQEHLLMAVVMLDIDHFKRLNDTYGHAAGDECLRTVAQRLLACTRPTEDVLVRWGGEEFCLVALVTEAAAAAALGERLRASVCAEPVLCDDVQITVTASVGVAVGVPKTRLDVFDLQLRADESLYAAKATGRNRCVLAPQPSAY